MRNELGFITWYTDDKLAIYFSTMPCVAVRYIAPTSTNEEKMSITRFPFINKRELKVQLVDKKKGKVYNFVIPKSYCYDGMTIPRFAWTLLGVSKESNGGLIASLLHDYLTEHKQIIENDRALSTNVFNALLYVGEVNSIKRFFMKNSVACYQTLLCRW